MLCMICIICVIYRVKGLECYTNNFFSPSSFMFPFHSSSNKIKSSVTLVWLKFPI